VHPGAQSKAEDGAERKIHINQASCNLDPADASQNRTEELEREQKELLVNISYIETS